MRLDNPSMGLCFQAGQNLLERWVHTIQPGRDFGQATLKIRRSLNKHGTDALRPRRSAFGRRTHEYIVGPMRKLVPPRGIDDTHDVLSCTPRMLRHHRTSPFIQHFASKVNHDLRLERNGSNPDICPKCLFTESGHSAINRKMS